MTAYRLIVSEKARYPLTLMFRVLRGVEVGLLRLAAAGPVGPGGVQPAAAGPDRPDPRRAQGLRRPTGPRRAARDTHGLKVSRKRVERLMRVHGLVGTHQRRRRCLTKQDKTATPAPDLLNRAFAASTPDKPIAPGARMVGDITQLATGESWLYIADVPDLGSRAVLGYAMADHMPAELVCDAMSMAAAALRLPDKAISHTDRGSQYTSAMFTQTCDQLGVKRSMSRVGSCLDNATAERSGRP